MLESLEMVYQKGTVLLLILMVQYMLEVLKEAKSMEPERLLAGLMDPSIPGNFKMEKNMEMVFINIQME